MAKAPASTYAVPNSTVTGLSPIIPIEGGVISVNELSLLALSMIIAPTILNKTF